jgi:hypothetical protein
MSGKAETTCVMIGSQSLKCLCSRAIPCLPWSWPHESGSAVFSSSLTMATMPYFPRPVGQSISEKGVGA